MQYKCFKMTGNNSAPLNILMLSKGTFEGNHICSALFGHNQYSTNPDTRSSQINGCNVSITNIKIALDGKNPTTVAREAQEKIRGNTYNAVVVVLALPIRSTPESQRHINTIKNIVGTKVLRSNGILLFTNGSYMYRNPRQFQQFLQNEIQASKRDGLREVSLGKLIKEVHYPGRQDWTQFGFDRCVLFDVDCKDNEHKAQQNEQLLNAIKPQTPFIATGPDFNVFFKILLCLLLAGILYVAFTIKNKETESQDTLHERQLQERENSIQGLMRTISDQRDDIQVYKTKLETKDSEIKDLKSKIATKDSEIQEFKSKFDTKYSELQQLKSKLDTKDSEIKEFKLKLDTKDCWIENLKSEIRAKTDTIENITKDKNDFKWQLQNATEINNGYLERITNLTKKLEFSEVQCFNRPDVKTAWELHSTSEEPVSDSGTSEKSELSWTGYILLSFFYNA